MPVNGLSCCWRSAAMMGIEQAKKTICTKGRVQMVKHITGKTSTHYKLVWRKQVMPRPALIGLSSALIG